MNYEQKYKEALERARKFRLPEDLIITEDIFPELKESEDERIRKFLYHTFTAQYLAKDKLGKWHGEPVTNILTWLEKQGEQKPNDEVEPKFKVGDWITNGKLLVGQVTSFDGEYYHYMQDGIEQPLHISNAYNWHLWTIKDVKGGDILTDKQNCTCIFREIMTDDVEESVIDAYCGINIYDKFVVNEKGEVWTVPEDLFPATKEQHDILFQKMHEAGYEWDANNKELRKIEQKSWSEEDEKFLNYAISLTDDTQINKFLKSLKDRVSQPHWKPSEKQLEALWNAIPNIPNSEKDIDTVTELSSLYEELKKL